MAKTSDKISELFGLLPSGYFKDEEELRGFVQDENSLKEVYSFLPQGYFSDENEYVSYFGDAIKKKAPTTPSLDYSAMARGEKSLLEQVIGVSLKKPVAKQEGVSLEASPSPSQVKTVKEEKPKVAYEATNPTSISMLSQMEADKNRLLYMDDRIKSLQGEYEERVKKEQEALFKKYQSRAEANPDQVEKLQAEFEDEITKLSELRAAEFSQVATNLLGQKEYRYLGKKASSLSQLFQNVIEGAGNAATKDRQIEEIAQSVLTTVPDEVKEAVRGEINSIVMDVAGGSDLGSMYLMQKTVADKMGRLQQAKADLEVQYQEALAKWKNAPQEVLSSAYAAGEAMLPTGTGVPKELQEIQKQRVALNNALNTYEKVLRVPTARDWAGVEAWRETVPDILTVGMAGTIEPLNVASLVFKQARGQTTEAEDAIIDAYGTLQLMKDMASEEFNAYRRNQSIAGSIPYIEQFLLTRGAGSVARKAGIEASKKFAESRMKSAFVRGLTNRVTRYTVEGAVSAGLRTPLAPATYKYIAEASMGDFKIENGQFVVDEATRLSMVKAIVEGTYTSASDIFSESLGGIVEIPSKWLNRALTPTVRKAFQTIQLNGLHGEFFEEIAAAIMQGEAVDREFLKDLLVTVPAMVGGMGVIAAAVMQGEAVGRAKRKDLIDTFGRDKITAIKDAIQAKDEDALVSLMSESGAKLIEEGMTPEKAQAKVKNLVEYATLYVAQTTKDEMSGAVEAKVEESVGAMPDELRAQPEAVQGELRFEPEIEETKPLTETSLTEKKAEIEQRRQDELTLTGKTIQWDNYGNEGMSEWNIGEKTKTRDGRDAVELWRRQEDDGGLSTFTQTVPIEEELLPKINAKYDAELAALETTSLTEEVPVKEQEEISVDMDWRYVRESIMGDRYLTPSEKKQAQTFARKLFEVGKSQGDVIARVNEKFGTNIKKQSTEPVSPPSDTQVSPTGESAAKAVPDNATGISQPVQHGSLTIPLEESYEGGADTTTYPIRVNGENRGKVDILSEQGISQIRWINVKRKETDTEMNGRNAYMTLRDQARARGDELISDIFFRRSAAAEKAWGRMVEDGLAVKVGNYYMFADAQNKEELAAKADKLEILRSIKGAAKAELVEGREAEVIQDFVDLTKDEFREKYKDHKDVNGLWMNARALDDLINTISRLSLSMEGGMKFTRKGLDLLRQSVTFAKDNNLTEKYGDISKIIGLLESEVQRRAGGVLEEERQETDAGDGGEANAGRGRGQVGRGTTDKTFTGEQVASAQHRQNIEQKFRDVFTKKGIPSEQVEGAIALMTARAESWASEQDGRTADMWYERIADIKEGEFESKSTPKLYQLPDGRQVMGMAMPEVTNGFYSPIEKRLVEFKQEKASVNKWKEIIGKGDEAIFTGVLDWLNGMKPDQSLTKAEIQQFMKDNRIEVVEVVKSDLKNSQEYIDAVNAEREAAQVYNFVQSDWRLDKLNAQKGKAVDEAAKELEIARKRKRELEDSQDQTKFQTYQLPGEKENYKEVLVTMPTKVKPLSDSENTELDKLLEKRLYEGLSIEEESKYRSLFTRRNTGGIEGQQFRSSHFDEPNILVHLRMNTRTDSEGKKVLFLEEVQSDFAQSYREEESAKNDYIDKNDLKIIEAFKKKGLLKIICPP